MIARLLGLLAVAATVALLSTGCKQGIGEVCQVNADCESELCNPITKVCQEPGDPIPDASQQDGPPEPDAGPDAPPDGPGTDSGPA